MIEAPVLTDEMERLSDLQSLNLLNGPAEERFDRLTRLARRALGMEMCYLALIDGDRQWFKSKCGIARDSTSRDVSFCGHTIAGNEMLEVPDALADERFNDNPLVTGDPHVRFYAGYPLKGPGDRNVGTFCVADSQPRDWSDEDRELFVEYAELAQRELVLMDVIETQNDLLKTRQELDKVRKNLERELGEAADFVHQKLPSRFDNERMKLDWEFIESSSLGGDMFGLEQLGDDQYLVYLLDVAGHGIGASLLAVTVQNTLRQNLRGMQGAISPAAVLQQLNSAFQMEANQNRFFTMWCGVVDLAARSIYFANGGHLAPVFFDASYNAWRLGQDSMMIGISLDSTFADEEIQYTPGSRLLVFSDGIVEELDENDNQFGRERLEQAYRNRCLESSCKLNSITEQVSLWNGNRPFSDDVSLLELTLK